MRLGGLRLERARASKQFRDGTFHNTLKLPMLKEFMFGRGKRKPPGAVPVGDPLEAWAQPISSSKMRVTWLGHSSCLLQLDGLKILTDPVFGPRIGPTSWVGPKRLHAAPVTVEQLPKLDAVLVSHDHFDHLCRPTIEAIAKLDVPVITSLGVGHHLEAFGVLPERIVELDWWELSPAQYRLCTIKLTTIDVGATKGDMAEALQNKLYTATATATAGRDGTAATDDGHLQVKLAPPKAMGGSGDGTNPEQLFAAGYAACFGSACGHVARSQKLNPGPISITAKVDIGPVGAGFGLQVELIASIPELPRDQAQKLIETAHQVCPYSNATRGNIVVAVKLA